MADFFTTEALSALLTLTAMEIVLGIDNIIFIAILSDKLPMESRGRIRNIGLFIALLMRVFLVLGITWIMKLTTPLFNFLNHDVTGKDLILLIGGLFLIAKSTFEIHSKVEGDDHGELKNSRASASKGAMLIIGQIIVLDLVFSLDSVITAVGMVSNIAIMITAMMIAVGVMLISASKVSNFVAAHPSIKILALSFLILIGVMLLMEGMGKHIDKGYIYFAMFFSLVVEMINMRYQKNKKPKI